MSFLVIGTLMAVVVGSFLFAVAALLVVFALHALWMLVTDPWGFVVVFAPPSWAWRKPSGWRRQLCLNHEPWQEAACKELVAKHGAEYFAGLNLFGVV